MLPSMTPDVVAKLPYLTAEIPGVGGRLKARPEDFLVEEQPLYPPIGEGEHLMLFLSKRNAATSDVVRRLAKLFSVKRSDIGYAGLKDKRAVTRQHFTIHLPHMSTEQAHERLKRIEHTPYTLLWAERHANKLRRGHLAGNRFVIYLRDVEPTAIIHARRTLLELERRGCPNYFGEQRFGYRGLNHRLGAELLRQRWEAFADLFLGAEGTDETDTTREARLAYERGEFDFALERLPRHMRNERHLLDLLRQGWDKAEAAAELDRQQCDFFVNAAQSAVFNDVLAQRIEAGDFDRLRIGDLAYKHDNGAVFAVSESDVADPRVAEREVSPSGPLWGPDMPRPAEPIASMEDEAAARHGLSAEAMSHGRHRCRGGRRALRLIVRDPDISGGVDDQGGYIRIAFEAPPGGYATSVLREVMKSG